MPGFDGTGPNGLGFFYGRGAGYCRTSAGFRPGVGRGAGRGFRMRYLPALSADMMAVPQQPDQADILRNRVTLLKQEIDILQKRIEEIESAN
ncbi:MAG: DUF5320 domain-containing protein [Candidatus Auribacterota bacterium]|jgi:hypothetical protein|nr:DUF5320 domain-containing protein [Candidatus Auribacterota bacterium]